MIDRRVRRVAGLYKRVHCGSELSNIDPVFAHATFTIALPIAPFLLCCLACFNAHYGLA